LNSIFDLHSTTPLRRGPTIGYVSYRSDSDFLVPMTLTVKAGMPRNRSGSGCRLKTTPSANRGHGHAQWTIRKARKRAPNATEQREADRLEAPAKNQGRLSILTKLQVEECARDLAMFKSSH
jgi:hypothetical protein